VAAVVCSDRPHHRRDLLASKPRLALDPGIPGGWAGVRYQRAPLRAQALLLYGPAFLAGRPCLCPYGARVVPAHWNWILIGVGVGAGLAYCLECAQGRYVKKL